MTFYWGIEHNQGFHFNPGITGPDSTSCIIYNWPGSCYNALDEVVLDPRSLKGCSENIAEIPDFTEGDDWLTDRLDRVLHGIGNISVM